jgi:hypothetical protein
VDEEKFEMGQIPKAVGIGWVCMIRYIFLVKMKYLFGEGVVLEHTMWHASPKEVCKQ